MYERNYDFVFMVMSYTTFLAAVFVFLGFFSVS